MITLALSLCVFALLVLAVAPSGRTYIYAANSEGSGISRFRLDEVSGHMERLEDIGTGGRASPLAAAPGGDYLYAALRGPEPAIAAFAINRTDGGAELLTRVPVPAAATYLRVDAGARFLLAASYGGDLAYVLPIGPGGFLQEEPSSVVRPGRNPHCIMLDHSNRFVFIPCLGSDMTAQFLFDERTGALQPNHPHILPLARESGPRHVAVSPDNRFVYVLSELSGDIACCSLDREHGTLHHLHSVSVIPPDEALPGGSYHPPDNSRGGENSPIPVVWAAEIRVAPNGRFVYASERTTSRLVCFRADPVSGRLDFSGVTETERQPRAFTLDPKGRYLVAAGERSGAVAVYRVNPASGTLAAVARYVTGERPNWVEMIHFS